MQISAEISRFHGVGIPFEVCEMSMAPSSDDVLVRVSLSTICGSDLHTVSVAVAQIPPAYSDTKSLVPLQHRHMYVPLPVKNYGTEIGLHGA